MKKYKVIRNNGTPPDESSKGLTFTFNVMKNYPEGIGRNLLVNRKCI